MNSKKNRGSDVDDEDLNISRDDMITLLNEDLSREYQAIIAYVVYSQILKGAAYTDIARELEVHAGEELEHALKISKQIDYLGGTPGVTSKLVELSDKPEDLLRFDLENERLTIANYRQRIRQAEAMGEYALSETLRGIILQEQEHEIDLAAALGIEVPIPAAQTRIDRVGNHSNGAGEPVVADPEARTRLKIQKDVTANPVKDINGATSRVSYLTSGKTASRSE